MSLDSAQKAEIKTFVDELSNKKEQLTLHEQQIVVKGVKDYLNGDRDLAPKEETLIKKTAKRYNWFISVLACAIFGTMAALAWFTIENIKQNAETKVAIITAAIKEAVMEDLKPFQEKSKKEIAETINYANHRTKEYKDYTDGVIKDTRDESNKLIRELIESHRKIQTIISQIEVTNENARKTTGGLEKTLVNVERTHTKAQELNGDLVEITKDLSQKAAMVQKYDGLFKTLKNGNDQLIFKKNKNKNQYYFQIGELLFVWGKEKINKSGSTEVKIDDRKFSSKDEMTISVTGCDFKGKDKGYPYVKDIESDSFTCRFVKGVLDKTDYLEKKEFYYMAVGKAATGS